jgi:hypothetical protein
MANSTHQSRQGPIWPLGSVVVATPGTVRNLMINVDPNLVNAPSVIVPGTVGSNEYTVKCNQIIIQGVKSNAGTGLTNNTGNIYVILKGNGSNNRTDTGAIIAQVATGQTLIIAPPATTVEMFNPYLIWLDADNSGDSGQVTLIL